MNYLKINFFMKKFYKIIFINILIFFVLLLLSEIFFRIYFNIFLNYNTEMWKYASILKKPIDNEKLPFVHYSSKKGKFYNVEISTNSHGFRDFEYEIHKSQNHKRILILGDSFTLGWGVPFLHTFSKKLEKNLNKSTNKFEVINAGIGNYNSTMEVELFKLHGIKFNPDLVILMFYINDVEPIPKMISKFSYFFKSNFFLYSFFSDNYLKIKAKIDKELEWKNYYSNIYNKQNEALKQNANSLIELISICKKKGIDLLFVNIPDLRDLKNYEFFFATKFIKDIANNNGIDFIDLYDIFKNYESKLLWVSDEDPHANSKANKIIEEELYKNIYNRKSIIF